jgi:phenylacetate-CoA ligase
MALISGLGLVSRYYSLLRRHNLRREMIVDFQARRLRRLIKHAYANVPYYRNLFDRNGIKPADIQTVDDLPNIPITTKEELRSLPANEVLASSVDPKSLIVRRTSGSTGEPFSIRRTWLEERILGMHRLRSMHDVGLRINDRMGSVVLVRPVHIRDSQLIMKILQAFGLYRQSQINCLLPPEEILSILRNLSPDILAGLPGVIFRLSQIIDVKDRLTLRPRFIVVGGEVLAPHMRHQISRAFDVSVFDFYSSHEFNLIAWECKDTHELHTCDDSVIVEVLKDDRTVAEGERGELVGTGLHSFAMPFIRYRLGDLVTKGSETCPCGQPFSTIRSVQGRMLDYFPLPGDKIIHPYEIILILVRNPLAYWIQQYRLIQEQLDRIVLEVVPHPTPSSEEIRKLEEYIRPSLGQNVEFKVLLVPEIKFEPNGKFRVSRSFVRSEYDRIDEVFQQTS